MSAAVIFGAISAESASECAMMPASAAPVVANWAA